MNKLFNSIRNKITNLFSRKQYPPIIITVGDFRKSLIMINDINMYSFNSSNCPLYHATKRVYPEITRVGIELIHISDYSILKICDIHSKSKGYTPDKFNEDRNIVIAFPKLSDDYILRKFKVKKYR